MKEICYLLFFIFNALSCTKDIAIDLDGHESKLVVNSFFSPANKIKVHVSASNPILGIDTLTYVSNATVKLYRSGLFIGELNYTHKGYYELLNQFKAGQDYTIEVNASHFNHIRSSNTIPFNVPIISFDTISLDNRYLYCELAFHDKAEDLNFYMLEIESQTPYFSEDSLLTRKVDFVVSDFIAENGKTGDIRKYIFFSDEHIQGQEYYLSFLLDKKYLSNASNENLNVLYINFMSISKAYYGYAKSYSESQNQQIDVFTNIENGYGIFAGFNLSQDSIVINY